MFWNRSSNQEAARGPQEIAKTSDAAQSTTTASEQDAAKPSIRTALEFGPSSEEGAEMLTGICDVTGQGLGACEWKVTKAVDEKPTNLYRILF